MRVHVVGADDGRAEGFEAFFAVEWRAVRRVAFRLSGDRMFAEDAAQEAMLQAWRAWVQIRHFDVPSFWVRRVAINLTVSHLRRKSPEAGAPVSYEDPEPVDVDAPVLVAVRSLPVRQATAVVLRYFEDMAIPDVAAVMGCSEMAVRQLCPEVVDSCDPSCRRRSWTVADDEALEQLLFDVGRRARESDTGAVPIFVPPEPSSEPDVLVADLENASVWDDDAALPGPDAVAALSARVRSIAYTRPLHVLEANKVRLGGEAWARLNMLELAFQAIDVIALRMDFDTGADYDGAVVAVASLARMQCPGLNDPERVGQRVVEGLISGRGGSDAEAHSSVYGFWGPDGYEVRRRDYALVTEHTDAQGEFYLRVTDEAITVLMGALELDVESAQVAAELRLRELVRRGLLSAAEREAESARYRTIRYQEQLRRQLAAARLHTTEPGVQEAVDALVDHAVEHVLARYRAEGLIISSVTRARDAAVDLAVVRKANRLIDRLSDCQRRHQALQRHLLRARSEFREARSEQLALPPGGPTVIDLERQLLRPLLELSLAAADGVCALAFRRCAGPEAPTLPDLDRLSGALCAATAKPGDLGDALDDDAQWEDVPVKLRFDDAVWDAAIGLREEIDGPVRLSVLAERAAALDDSGALVHLVALRAAHDVDPAMGDRLRRGGDDPFLVAWSDGIVFDAGIVAGDDLLLARARLVPDPGDGPLDPFAPDVE